MAELGLDDKQHIYLDHSREVIIHVGNLEFTILPNAHGHYVTILPVEGKSLTWRKLGGNLLVRNAAKR